MAVFYSPFICRMIGHSHVLTKNGTCARCNTMFNTENKGVWLHHEQRIAQCNYCIANLATLKWRDTWFLPESAFAQLCTIRRRAQL